MITWERSKEDYLELPKPMLKRTEDWKERREIQELSGKKKTDKMKKNWWNNTLTDKHKSM